MNSLKSKRPDAAFVAIDADHWSPATIEEHLDGQGLFSNKYIIFLDRVAENIEAKEQIAGFAEAMNESANIFIVLEGRLNAELKKAFEKHAERSVENDDAVSFGAGKADGKSIFALADALGARDSFKAWSLYCEAIGAGTEPENIVGTLFWQAKSMAVAAKSKSVVESDMNPFVFNKSKRYAANYSSVELHSLLRNLTVLYHDAHRGAIDLELGIERLLLGIKSEL